MTGTEMLDAGDDLVTFYTQAGGGDLLAASFLFRSFAWHRVAEEMPPGFERSEAEYQAVRDRQLADALAGAR